MNDIQKIERVYVAQQLQKTADKVYNQMYGDWKSAKLDIMKIKAPNKLVFDYDVQAMLPQKYMNGVSGYHPNALYKAVLEKNTEKVTEIIKNTQYLTVKQFAEQYGVDADIAEREWESLWMIVSDGNAYDRIPTAVADAFYRWITGTYTTYSFCQKTSKGKLGASNLVVFNGVVDAFNIASRCAFLESSSEDEFREELRYFRTDGNVRFIDSICNIWKK